MTRDTYNHIGPVGVWNLSLSSADPHVQSRNREAAAELEELGYGAIWLGGSPGVDRAVALIDATSRITVATGILSIWQDSADDVAKSVAALDDATNDRFILGLGVSHAPMTPGYSRPYAKMAEYLGELDAAPVPVPAEQRVLAALGPKMLKLAADRAGGAHPYLVTVEHVVRARAALGPDRLLAPELGVVLGADLTRARATARAALAYYLPLPNYTDNWLRLGFTGQDLADGGSDRLIDALFALGDIDTVRARIGAFHDAGADHVALQVLEPDGELPREQWRELAAALDLT